MPVHPAQRGELQVVDRLPGPSARASDELGLEEGVDALGEGIDAPIGQDRISGSFGELQPGPMIDHHSLVDLSSQVALQAPDDVLLRESLLGPSSDVVNCRLVESHADDDCSIESRIRLAVASSIETVLVRHP